MEDQVYFGSDLVIIVDHEIDSNCYSLEDEDDDE